jgi:hypothetical protein
MKINAASRLLTQEAFLEELLNFFEGNKVSRQWLKQVSQMRDTGPSEAYRLILVPRTKRIQVGTRIRLVSKPVVSVSDRVVNAVYAGSSFHDDVGTDLEGTQVVVVRIDSPSYLISFKSLIRFSEQAVRKFRFSKEAIHVRRRLKEEREYLIDGSRLVGTVVHYTKDTEFISKGDYRKLREKR